jgi:hypothetical protein
LLLLGGTSDDRLSLPTVPPASRSGHSGRGRVDMDVQELLTYANFQRRRSP